MSSPVLLVRNWLSSLLGNSGGLVFQMVVSTSFWVWYVKLLPGMWIREGFSICVEENSINVSNKKYAKVLTVCHRKYFSPETSDELLKMEDMLLTKPILLFFPSFLPRCKFCMYILNSLLRVFVVYILTSIAELAILLFSWDRNLGNFLDDILLNYSVRGYHEESLQKGLFTETDLASLSSK